MKTHKNLLLILFIFCAPFILFGCQRRDLSSPSSRLVGHWQSPDDDYEIYFGPIDKDTRIGTLIMVDKDGKAVYFRYKVTSENHDGEELEFAMSLDESLRVSNPYWVTKNGLELSDNRLGKITFIYVDNKTEP